MPENFTLYLNSIECVPLALRLQPDLNMAYKSVHPAILLVGFCLRPQWPFPAVWCPRPCFIPSALPEFLFPICLLKKCLVFQLRSQKLLSRGSGTMWGPLFLDSHVAFLLSLKQLANSDQIIMCVASLIFVFSAGCKLCCIKITSVHLCCIWLCLPIIRPFAR